MKLSSFLHTKPGMYLALTTHITHVRNIRKKTTVDSRCLDLAYLE